jgi:membrane protein DedA with SNARE-associated domain
MIELEHVSYLGIVVALILTGMGLPVPEEVFVIIAGIASSQGALEPAPALAACLLGAILGDCAMYAIGYHFGHGLLRDHRWFARFLKPDRERHVEHMIQKHGLKVFLIARFLVGLRTPVYVTAGILRVPFRQFIVADAFCAFLVVSTFFGLSYAFAEQISSLWGRIRQAEIALTVVILAGVAAVLLYLYLRGRRRLARLVRLRRMRKAREHAHQRESVEESRSIV